MAVFYDLLLVLTPDDRVQSIQFACPEESLPNQGEMERWVGLTLEEIPDIKWDFSSQTARLGNCRFVLRFLSPGPQVRCLLLRREDVRQKLMEAALNLLPDGIQIYDDQARVQFFNRSFQSLLELPQSECVEGKNILNIFSVDPEYSSTLAALNLRTSVQGRFDCYKSFTGKELLTVNESYPVFEEGRLLGCVTIERDNKMIEQQRSAYGNLQQIIFRHLSSSLEQPKGTRYTLHDLVGSDPLLLAAKKLAAKMALRDVNILIQGETGTGKEIFAQGMHNLSSRKNEPFVALNCAAFPESLIEGLLFGTTKGAFTGSTDKMGLIEEANHGTLFLDELNSMSLGMQAKLLRVVQEKTLRRVGSTKSIPVDVRIISSCNEDAYALSERGVLRPDLFYRLASVVVEIPPLRERLDDIPQLTWHYLRHHPGVTARSIADISPAFWERLRQHRWPGNVRELFHVLDYAVNDCEGTVLQEENLPSHFRREQPLPAEDGQPSESLPEDLFGEGLASLMQQHEQQLITQAYRLARGNVRKAAALLKISRQNFQYYARKYHLGNR